MVTVTAVTSTFNLELRCDGCNAKTHFGNIVRLAANGPFKPDDYLRERGWVIQNRTLPNPFYGRPVIPRTDRFCPACATKRKICIHAEHPCPIWHSAEGDIPVCTMTKEHLDNATRFVAGQIASDFDAVRRKLDHAKEANERLTMLVAEAKRRGG